MRNESNLKKLFPNTSTVAYYNSFGQYIVYNDIKKVDYESAIQDVSNPKNLKILQTISHELRHWRDHHTTLWGVKDLVDIFNAVNARISDNPENFHLISRYFKNSKQSDLTEYYHTINSNYKVKKNGLPWKLNISYGSRFDYNGSINVNKPIPFVRFLNPENETLISRTPLSNSSLLEVNAMAEELKISKSVISQLNKIKLLSETRLLESQYFSWLYHEEFTLYSAIVHLVSSFTKVKDIVISFNIANELSNLLLNLPDNLYEQIPTNSYLQEFGNKNQLFREQKDNGFALLNLLLNYKDKYENHDSFDIEYALEASNLPSAVEIEKLIIKEFILLKEAVIDGPFKPLIIKKIENAVKYFESIGLNSAHTQVLDFSSFENPVILFKDSNFEDNKFTFNDFKTFVISGSKLTGVSWLLFNEIVYDELETFNNICGV